MRTKDVGGRPGRRANGVPGFRVLALAAGALLGAGLHGAGILGAGGEGGYQPGAGVLQAASAIREDVLRAHTRFLADDLLEGRAPGSRGDSLAQLYISTQFQALGLEPAGPRRSWLQPVPLVGIAGRMPPAMTFRARGASLELRRQEDFIAASGLAKPLASLRAAEVVFVGYGISAPEEKWDDFKDADLRGKVLLVMNNDPSSDPRSFGGEMRLYYGRWDYKYETAARKGAAAAIIIHTTPSAGYPWQVVQTSWTGEQFGLQGNEGPALEVESWVTEDAARRIALLGGFDLDSLRRSAEGRDFRPVPLGVTLSLEMPSEVRAVQSANVLGMVRGSDPELRDEVVIYTAHHDHLGVASDGDAGSDRINNGAVDNASGVAALLALAGAFRTLEKPPRRTILFAAVAAEEQGLLGSALLAAQPPVPPGRLAAVINIDGINIWGRTRDITFVGHGKSSLDGTVEAVARWQGRIVRPDQFPDRGFFYRSDQFSLAKIGVPGIYLDGGTDFVGRPAGWGKEQIEEWERTRYHQPSDEYSSEWDLTGAVEDIQLLFHAGLETAQAAALPTWRPGDEFEAARKKAIGAR